MDTKLLVDFSLDEERWSSLLQKAAKQNLILCRDPKNPKEYNGHVSFIEHAQYSRNVAQRLVKIGMRWNFAVSLFDAVVYADIGKLFMPDNNFVGHGEISAMISPDCIKRIIKKHEVIEVLTNNLSRLLVGNDCETYYSAAMIALCQIRGASEAEKHNPHLNSLVNTLREKGYPCLPYERLISA